MKRISRAARLRELEQRNDLVVVDAANDHRVDLEARERIDGRVDAGEHARQLVETRQLHEAIALQRVEADRQAMQAGALEIVHGRREQHRVGRHREIANPVLARQPLDQRRQVAAEQRFAAGQPHLVDAETQELIDEPIDLLELQDVLARQPDVVLLGHAVLAAQVAAIGDRQPEIGQRPLVGVENWHYPSIIP